MEFIAFETCERSTEDRGYTNKQVVISMRKPFFNIVLYSILFFSAPGLAEQESAYVQVFPNGSIDWNAHTVWAAGRVVAQGMDDCQESESLKLEAAVEKARKNLLDLIFGVRVDAATLVEELAAGDKQLRDEIVGMVEKAPVVEQGKLPEGVAEAVVEMPFSGGFSQMVLPEEITQLQSIRPMPKKEAPRYANAKASPDAFGIGPSEAYTGLVIDASGLKAVPALAPRILDEKGEQVYGASYISREYAVQTGVCGYSKSLEAALSDARVAGNPLVVKGLRTNGPALSDIVVSNTDAQKIRGASENLTLLKKCRVMMVLD
jgi:hypothetical protein